MNQTIRNNRERLRAFRRMFQDALRTAKSELKVRQQQLDSFDRRRTKEETKGKKTFQPASWDSARSQYLQNVVRMENKLRSLRSFLAAAEGDAMVPRKYRHDPTFGRETFATIHIVTR